MNKEYMLVAADKFELPIASYHTLSGLYERLTKNNVINCSISNFRGALQKGYNIVLSNGQKAKLIKVEF